jgi:hypothetical protein
MSVHSHIGKFCACVVTAVALFSNAQAQEPTLRPLGIGLEDIDYPYPVHFFDLTIDGQALRMAYMDVAPSGPSNGKAVVLLHCKSFSGDYCAPTIAKLSADGYRVVVPGVYLDIYEISFVNCSNASSNVITQPSST